MKLQVNHQTHLLTDESAPPEMPLLWVLRDVLNLTGTKYGCGIAACGACTVHVDGQAVRSCVTPVGTVQGHEVRTIEGLAASMSPPSRGETAAEVHAADTQRLLHPVQQMWITHQVPQCGYCQSGLLMAAAALLAQTTTPSDAQIDAAITHICRCGTTPRIRAAVHAAAQRMRERATLPAGRQR